MTREEFHRRYEQCPKHLKAELIEGVVYVSSPLGLPHGTHQPELSGVLWIYKGATPGVEVMDNVTTILGPENELQPDLALRILPEWGGRSRTTAESYVEGAPELVAEVAHSSRNIDLHQKRDAYQQAGVLEYVVWSIEEPELHWFDFRTGQPLRANRQGVYRSRVFAGLWIHREALLTRDSLRIIALVQEGLASRAHGAFVKRLKAARRKKARD
jgi:Uma2 family endonuclease